MLCVGKLWTLDESDAMSCIKGYYAATLLVKSSTTSVEKKNTQSGSSINSQTITTTAKDYYLFPQNLVAIATVV